MLPIFGANVRWKRKKKGEIATSCLNIEETIIDNEK
jgi:hypothetical protein